MTSGSVHRQDRTARCARRSRENGGSRAFKALRHGGDVALVEADRFSDAADGELGHESSVTQQMWPGLAELSVNFDNRETASVDVTDARSDLGQTARRFTVSQSGLTRSAAILGNGNRPAYRRAGCASANLQSHLRKEWALRRTKRRVLIYDPNDHSPSPTSSTGTSHVTAANSLRVILTSWSCATIFT